MKFCLRCGNEILKGDKFCTKCGAEQCDDGLIQKNDKESFYNDKDKNVIWEIKRILITEFLEPVDVCKEVIERVSKNTIRCLTVFMIIIQGILGIWYTNMILGNLKSIAEGFVKQVPKFMQFQDFNIKHFMISPEDIIEMQSLLNISYRKIFINNSIMVLIVILTTFLVLYVGTNMVLKTKVDCWKIYKINLAVLLPIMYFEIFAILASYISLNLGEILFIIGIVISISSLVIALKDKIQINDNKCVLIVAICTVIVFSVISFYVKRFMILDYINLFNSFKDVRFNL